MYFCYNFLVDIVFELKEYSVSDRHVCVASFDMLKKCLVWCGVF